ncbi:Gfo/Idh/MocA family oxidoreductase [soil metagenome]
MKRRTFHTLALASVAATYGSTRAESGRSRIKIGQIGTKHAHAGGQLAALRQCPDFEVVGVVEPDEAQRKKMEQTADFAGLPWMTEEELFNAPGLQVVSVETEVGQLLDSAEKVVQAGLHLHLDKPAGESLPQFRRILDTASDKQRLVKMGYMFRYNPAFRLLMRAVREGWLGEVFSIHAEMSKLLGDGERKPMLRYAGGSMFELGCHLIDSVVRILGKPESVSPHIYRSRDDGYADNMTAVLDYPKATVTLRSAMIEVDGGARRQFVVCGTKGTIEIRPLEPPAMKLTLDQPHDNFRKGLQEVTFEKAPRYAADWLDFAKAIRGEVRWEFNPKHDLAVQETVLRASGLPLG